MPDEPEAMRKFAALTDEATRWKGRPPRFEDAGPRRVAAWPDFEIRQIGRGIMVRARALYVYDKQLVRLPALPALQVLDELAGRGCLVYV